MASVPAPRFPSPSSSAHTIPNPNKFPSKTLRLLATSPRCTLPPFKKPTTSASRASDSALCRCGNSQSESSSQNDDSGLRRWDSILQDAVKSAIKRWEDYVNSYRNPSSKTIAPINVAVDEEEEKEKEEEIEEVDWDWERWKRHFVEIEEQERIVSVLKSQLGDAVAREDYEDAAKLKLAIAAAATNDTVGRAISYFKRAIEEERYQDAAFIQDNAGAGLVGWWAGISEDTADPYGRIIRISAEHGRYLARSYSSRQLATARPGFPVFEIFFTVTGEGEYKQQAVYLKRNSRIFGDFRRKSTRTSDISSLNPLDGSTEEKNDISTEGIQVVEERDDESDVADGLASIQNVLRDMIPGVKVQVLKVVSTGKVDRDLISKVIEQIMEEEDEDKDEDLEIIEPEDIVRAESDNEEVELDAGDATSDASVEQSEVSVKFVIGTLMQKLSTDAPPKDLVRVPAMLEKKGRFSFSLSIKQDDKQQETDGKGPALLDKVAARPSRRNVDLVMSDLAKVFLSKEKIPMKVLKDVGELISFTINQDQNHQPLSGMTLFNRIEIPTTSDPLSGLYVGAHGPYTSEILHLKRKFGQWQEDSGSQTHMDLEFYEYVEAFKLTGGLSVPAGQVAFRAKVGKRYQLPHKGIIPEEFGVVARYKGQGRLADPGFRNSRWVDGELVILDGKYIKAGPVIGFVYWAPEFHFLVFFNRLRLPE